MRNYDDDEPYVVIEERSDVGSFLLGAALGAGVALLFAPRSGAAVRGEIKRRVKRASDGVAGTFHDARERVEQRLESARIALEEKRQRVSDAVAAGRAAARDAAAVARRDLNERLSQPARPRGAGVGRGESGGQRAGAYGAVEHAGPERRRHDDTPFDASAGANSEADAGARGGDAGARGEGDAGARGGGDAGARGGGDAGAREDAGADASAREARASGDEG